MEEQLKRENHMDWFVNDVRVFQHREFGILRCIKLDGKDYFIGKDATISLGYVNSTDTLKKRVSDTEKCYAGINDGNRTRRMVVITINGLNQLIKTGKLPLAHKYGIWINNQVLPALSRNELVPVYTEQMAEIVPIVEQQQPIALEVMKNMLCYSQIKGLSISFGKHGTITKLTVDEITVR